MKADHPAKGVVVFVKRPKPHPYLTAAFWIQVAAFGAAAAAHEGLWMVGIAASVCVLGLIGLWRARGTVNGWLEPSEKVRR